MGASRRETEKKQDDCNVMQCHARKLVVLQLPSRYSHTVNSQSGVSTHPRVHHFNTQYSRVIFDTEAWER